MLFQMHRILETPDNLHTLRLPEGGGALLQLPPPCLAGWAHSPQLVYSSTGASIPHPLSLFKKAGSLARSCRWTQKQMSLLLSLLCLHAQQFPILIHIF